jgi:hypothetical protein
MDVAAIPCRRDNPVELIPQGIDGSYITNIHIVRIVRPLCSYRPLQRWAYCLKRHHPNLIIKHYESTLDRSNRFWPR